MSNGKVSEKLLILILFCTLFLSVKKLGFLILIDLYKYS